jgi:hypothetical protein
LAEISRLVNQERIRKVLNPEDSTSKSFYSQVIYAEPLIFIPPTTRALLDQA